MADASFGYPEWFSELAVVRHFGFLSVTMSVFIVLAFVGWDRVNGRIRRAPWTGKAAVLSRSAGCDGSMIHMVHCDDV